LGSVLAGGYVKLRTGLRVFADLSHDFLVDLLHFLFDLA
jgi:hypothetical protein